MALLTILVSTRFGFGANAIETSFEQGRLHVLAPRFQFAFLFCIFG